MSRWGRFAVAYACIGALAVAIALLWREGSPFELDDPWLELSTTSRHLYSLLIGLAFGALVVVLTRPIVGRFAWARRLHSELRPFAQGMSPTGIGALAVLSSLGEELVFRGLLLPWLGLVPQALVFGIVHYLPGPSRWTWVVWASLIGLALGAIFQWTGSLAGPLAAHALINGVNLNYLKNHDPDPQRRSLGGLLGERL